MKTIQLTRGYVALVDDSDFERLNRFRWYAGVLKTGYSFAKKDKSSECQFIVMSRMILNITDKSVLVDHKDQNPLNNQRENLRICNKSQNGCNVKARKNSFSRYKGVTWVKRESIWTAQIMKDYKNIHLGRFKKEEDAALAYNLKAAELHGEFANLNQIPTI